MKKYKEIRFSLNESEYELLKKAKNFDDLNTMTDHSYCKLAVLRNFRDTMVECLSGKQNER